MKLIFAILIMTVQYGWDCGRVLAAGNGGSTDKPAGEETMLADDETGPGGDFIYVEGDVKIRQSGEDEWTDIKDNTEVASDSEIKLGENSYAEIKIGNNKTVQGNEETMFRVVKKQQNSALEIMYGSLKAKVEKLREGDFEIRTPVAVAAVRGTEFAVLYEEEDKAAVEVYDGNVAVENEPDSGNPEEITVDKDNWAEVKKNSKPDFKGMITENRKLRWEHLKAKKQMFMDMRDLKKIDFRILRLEKRIKFIRDPEKKEEARARLAELKNTRDTVKKRLKDNRDRQKELGSRYSELRKKNAEARKDFISRRTRHIIKERREKIKDKLRERKEKLEKLKNRKRIKRKR